MTGGRVALVTRSFGACEGRWRGRFIAGRGLNACRCALALVVLALCKGNTVSINGEGDPTRFQYYGLAKNKEVKIKKKGADVSGVLYAPSARVLIEGQNGWIGSIVGKCVHLKHDGALHFDEAINKNGTEFDLYVIHSWKEM